MQALADFVNGGGDTTNLIFKLNADISGVDFNIGNSSVNSFKGTLDGDGHTITVNLNTSTDVCCALFRYVTDATIKNLTVDGTINTSKADAAGIAGCVYGTTNITNCRSSVTITSMDIVDGSHGGFVGVTASGNTVITFGNDTYAVGSITLAAKTG